jgi:hypothetical protein
MLARYSILISRTVRWILSLGPPKSMVPASGTERISLESAEKMQEMHRNPQGNIVNQRNTEAVFRT